MARKSPVPVPAGGKYCFMCETLLKLDDFHPRASAKDGRASPCRTCTKGRAARSAAMLAVMEQALAEMAEYRLRCPSVPYEWPIAPMSVRS